MWVSGWSTAPSTAGLQLGVGRLTCVYSLVGGVYGRGGEEGGDVGGLDADAAALVAEADLLEGYFVAGEECAEAGVVEVGRGGTGLKGVVQLAHVDPGAVADEGLDAEEESAPEFLLGGRDGRDRAAGRARPRRRRPPR